MATNPPASKPSDQGLHPKEAATESTSLPTEDQRLLREAPDAAAPPEVVVDLTAPTRPLIIDLLRPEIVPPDIPVSGVRRVELIGELGLLAAKRWQRVLKRTIDLAGSLLLLVILAPLMSLIALAIAVTSKGPVIYTQRRIGKDGRPFTMWKFRSMTDGAHEMRHLYAHRNRHTHGPVFKIPNDPRVTSVGRLIRRTSLDELPQLMNVLRGEMSLVGPRPALPEEFASCDELVRQRTLVAPGLTCIWQVSGRSDVDFLRWVDMDLEYIKTWSIRLDLKLLILTIPAVVRGRGAY